MYLRFFILIVSLFALSCKSETYLYDKTGFDIGDSPNGANNPNPIVKTAPDYYYRQPYQGQQMQQPYYSQQYNGQPPSQYYQPQQQFYQQNPYQPYVAPGSRFYSNPYAIPPANNYPYYDADQYYVPPTYYNNIENQQFQKPSVMER